LKEDSKGFVLKVILGEGYPKKSILCSLILSLTLFFYILVIALIINPDLYILNDRVTYHTFLSEEFVIDGLIIVVMIDSLFISWIYLSKPKDKGNWAIILSFITGFFTLGSVYHFSPAQSVAMSSVPIALSILMFSVVRKNPNPIEENRLGLNYFSLIILGVSIFSLCLSLSGSTHLHDPFLMIYLIFSYLSPGIMFGIIFSVPIGILIRLLLSSLRYIRFPQIEFPQMRLGASHNMVYLLSVIALSIFFVSIPLLEKTTDRDRNLSVDIVYYRTWLSQLQNSSSTEDFLHQIFVEINGGDRPFALLYLYPFVLIGDDDFSNVIEFVMPLMLAPILVVLIFFLTREITSNDKIALISSFLTAVSSQILIGIYAGYYANWIALVIGYLSTTFLIRYLKGPSNRQSLYFTLYCASMFVLMFTHIYTWTIFMIFSAVFCIVSYFSGMVKRKYVLNVIVVIVLLLMFDLSKSLLGLGGGVERDLLVSESRELGLEQFGSRWSNLVGTVQVYVGGLFSNVFFLAATLVGCLILAFRRDTLSIFVLVFVSIGILPLFFGNREVMARALFDIPFQIPAAAGLFLLQKYGTTGNVIFVAISSSITAGSIFMAINI
jgi:hypothetical protein